MTQFYVSSKGLIGNVFSTNKDVTVQKFFIDFETKHMKYLGEFRWNLKTKVEILDTSKVEEKLTGREINVTLIRLCKKENPSTYFVVCIDLENDQFTPLRKFETSSSLQAISNVGILNGPNIFACFETEIFIYNSQESVIYERFGFNAKLLEDKCAQCCKNSKIKLKCERLLQFVTICDKHLLFLSFILKQKCLEHGSYNDTIFKVLQFSENQFTVLNTRHFIPDEYVKCVGTLCIKHIESQPEIFHCELYIGTSDGYVVYLKNGNLVNCCNISEDCAITSLKIFSLTSPYGKPHSSDSNHATGVLAQTDDNLWTELSADLQIKNTYSGVSNILSGDFMKDGSEQFLLLKEEITEKVAWALTDLKTKCFTSDQGVDGQISQREPSKSASCITAVKALKTRLQGEENLLRDEQAQLYQQADFISEMFTKQVSIATGVSLKDQTYQPSMVNLIKGENEGCEQVCPSRINVDPAVKVKGHWQRTYEGSWCVGVDLVCQSERLIKVWLDVLPDKSHSNSVSKKSSCVTLAGNHSTWSKGFLITKKENQTTGSDDLSAGTRSHLVPLKRKKLCENGTFESPVKLPMDNQDVKAIQSEGTVVCVLPLPAFGFRDYITANLVLNWMYITTDNSSGSYDDISDSERGDKDRSKVFTLCCGKVRLKASDVIEAKYRLNFDIGPDDQAMQDFQEVRNNQLAWQHIQTVHCLVFKGSPAVLARLESHLTSTCGFVYNMHYDCYITKVQSLSRVQLRLANQTSDQQRPLTVYTSEDKDLFLMIHYLYGHLPDHVTILPREDTSAKTVQRCLQAIQKEADFLSHGLQKLLSDHECEVEQASVDMDGDDGDDLRKVGEKFKRRRENLMKRKNDLMNNEKVKEFIKKYRRFQDQADLAVIASNNSS